MKHKDRNNDTVKANSVTYPDEILSQKYLHFKKTEEGENVFLVRLFVIKFMIEEYK